jgi:hypothetical protein
MHRSKYKWRNIYDLTTDDIKFHITKLDEAYKILKYTVNGDTRNNIN